VGMVYSKWKVEQLKKGIVAFGRIIAIHGNSCALREKVLVFATRECFDAFVQEASCPQLLEENIVPRDIKMSSSLCYGRTW
jgi:hypothetical protein